MINKKVTASSKVLRRDFFVDLFTSDKMAEFLLIYFGGSGIDMAKYRVRSKTVTPVFDRYFLKLEQELAFAFCYIPSPPDVNIIELDNREDDNKRWLEHLQTELIPLLPDLPFYFIGYSGGIALATCGMHLSKSCIGGGALGADQIPKDLERGISWKEPLSLYYNLSDRVYQANAIIINELQENEVVRCFRKLPGTHELQDYLINESFGGLVRRAGRLFLGYH